MEGNSMSHDDYLASALEAQATHRRRSAPLPPLNKVQPLNNKVESLLLTAFDVSSDKATTEQRALRAIGCAAVNELRIRADQIEVLRLEREEIERRYANLNDALKYASGDLEVQRKYRRQAENALTEADVALSEITNLFVPPDHDPPTRPELPRYIANALSDGRCRQLLQERIKAFLDADAKGQPEQAVPGGRPRT
jgi:hypothetical protein